MTENKRFIIDDAGELIDLNIPKFVDWGDDVCELLNQLVNENEELKNEIYEWKASAEDYLKLGKSVLKENEQFKKDNEICKEAYLELKSDAIHLKEENKQLKSENERLQHFESIYRQRALQLQKENKQLKNTIREAYQTERTQIGKNVLKQLLEAIQ